MPTLVPIRVKIGLRANGHADHPDWTQLPMITTDNDVKQYAPFGWMYDKVSGHQDERVSGSWASPIGEQWGCLLTTQAFATEALTVFPTLITQLNEQQFRIFYDDMVMQHVPNRKYDLQILQGLQIELDLVEKLGWNTNPIKLKIAKAIDEDDETEPGIKKNKNKKWADFKVEKGITIS